ncbi:MAG: polysaccharide biosynthesis tyrosine autokinase, partial [Gemmatimonadota bacterium]|nr:polysaccharide biosynthesis tyrosine autokinase [Gemmatimonadota bacterium]
AALGRMLAQARTASRESGGASPYRRLLAFPSLLRNQAASEMLGSLAKLEDQRAELLTRRKPGDADVQVLTRRIDELEGQMAGMVTAYEQGLSNQVASIDATLGKFESRLNRLPAKELEFARLSRQTKVLGDMYGLLQTRLKEAEIAEAVQDASVRVVDPARLLSRPAGPAEPMVLGISGLFGLLLGIALGFVREYRDVSVHSRGDLQAATGLPVLGWIPRLEGLAGESNGISATLRGIQGRLLPRARRTEVALAEVAPAIPALPASRLLGDGRPHASAAESYEWVHRNVLFSRPDSPVRTLLVTSSLPGEGKTTTAAGLAMTLARRGHKVLLVDADLRRGGVSQQLRAPRGQGLSELLVGAASFGQVVQSLDAGDGKALHYLPAGALPADPAQLLGSVRAAVLMEWLRERYYLVILDSAPLNIFADAAVLGEHTDGVVLVARAGVTPFDALVHCAEQCRTAQLPVLGTVLNAVDPARDGGYDAAYRWYQYGKAYYAEAGRV